MTGHRPQPMTAGDEYLALLLDELARQGEVLADIRDRLPSKEEEPVTAPTGGSGPEPVELREPSVAGGQFVAANSEVPATTDAPPPPPPPAKKAASAKRGGRRT